MKTLKHGQWFSRHMPTEQQIIDARNMGYEIGGIELGIALGKRHIQDENDAVIIYGELYNAVESCGVDAPVFGVFSTPIQEILSRNIAESENRFHVCYASWNLTRAFNGGTLVHTHKKWCIVGVM